MQIRPFESKDLDSILELFYNTVHAVNKADYSKAQLEAWAPKKLDKDRWLEKLKNRLTLIVQMDNTLVGFIDLTEDDLLDHLYVHKNFQRQGIASALLQKIIHEAKNIKLNKIRTESTITTKPFFEKYGFKVQKINQKERRGEIFKTYLMEKTLLPKNSK